MLSVLIPIYEQDPSDLLDDVLRQSGIDQVEVVVCDDGSPGWHTQCEELYMKYPSVIWLHNEVNSGRSATRNRLLEAATQPYVIFIDGDCRIPEERTDYLTRYRSQMAEDVICCGGHIYRMASPDNLHLLHYTYGRQREVVALATRQEAPLRYFFSSNICGPRLRLSHMRFDEGAKAGYGYEDSELASRWQAQGGRIQHMDNPVIHDGLTTNQQFLHKADQALERLAYAAHHDQLSHVKLLRVYKQMIRWPLVPWILTCCLPLLASIRRSLIKHGGSLRRLDVYRLLRFHEAMKAQDP